MKFEIGQDIIHYCRHECLFSRGKITRILPHSAAFKANSGILFAPRGLDEFFDPTNTDDLKRLKAQLEDARYSATNAAEEVQEMIWKLEEN